MNNVSRRDALKVVAVGAALCGTTVATTAAAQEPAKAEAAPVTVIAAGFVTHDGKAISTGGAKFTVAKDNQTPAGLYRIVFAQELASVPVVVATCDGGQRGCHAIVSSRTKQGFVVETRSYDANGLSAAGFNFIIVKVQDERTP